MNYNYSLSLVEFYKYLRGERASGLNIQICYDSRYVIVSESTKSYDEFTRPT